MNDYKVPYPDDPKLIRLLTRVIGAATFLGRLEERFGESCDQVSKQKKHFLAYVSDLKDYINNNYRKNKK